MTNWFATTVLFLLTSTVTTVEARLMEEPGTPAAKNFDDIRSNNEMKSSSKLTRHIRSAGKGEPCVTISRLAGLKEQFSSSLDQNKDGRASFSEVRDFLQIFKPTVSDEKVKEFIGRRDENLNGAIDFAPEYVRDMASPDYTPAAANEWFYLHDTNSDQTVTEGELVGAAQGLGMSFQQALENVRGYYMPADVDGDNRLSFEEFKTLYQPFR